MNNTYTFRNLNGDERNVVKGIAKELGLLSDLSSNKKALFVYRNQMTFEQERIERTKQTKTKVKAGKVNERA